MGDWASGWAYDPSAEAELELMIGDDTLMRWPRTIRRADVDQAVKSAKDLKGFSIGLGAVATALALSPAPRPQAALRFGTQTYPIEPSPPAGPLRDHLAHIADAWLSDQNHLRLRLVNPGVEWVVAQIGHPVRHAAAPGPDREIIVTVRLDDPLRPVLIGVISAEGAAISALPFPSLLRGGLHAAEGFAMSGGSPERLADYAYELACNLITRPRQRKIVLANEETSALCPHQMLPFLEHHAAVTRDVGEDGALTLDRNDVPTLASLAGGGRGWLAVSPPPVASATLVDKVSDPALELLSPRPRLPAPTIEPDTGRPLVIRQQSAMSADASTLLYPLAPPSCPERAAPLPPHLSIVLTAENTATASSPVSSLPMETPNYDAREPLPAAATDGTGPTLFLNRAITLHDPRTILMLSQMIAVPHTATAGCLIVREAHHGDADPADRIVSGGLMGNEACASEPWRAPLAPLNPWPMLFRDTYHVAANHPSCVLVSAQTLAEHANGLHRWDALDLLELMRRASAANLNHAVTTWYSVFDTRADPSPLPALAPLPLWPERRSTRLVRLC